MEGLTEAQKAALPGLQKQARREAVRIGLTSFAMTFLGVFVIIAVNETLIHSNFFCFGMALLTGIMSSNNASHARQEAILKYAEKLKNVK